MGLRIVITANLRRLARDTFKNCSKLNVCLVVLFGSFIYAMHINLHFTHHRG